MKKFSCLLLALALALLAGCGKRNESSEEVPALLPAAGVASDTFTVCRGDLRVPKVYDSSVCAYTEELYLTENAYVDEVFVYSGKQVRQGELLISLNLDAERETARRLQSEIDYTEEINRIDREIALAQIALLKNELASLTASGADDRTLALKALDIEQAEADLKHDTAQRELALESRYEELERVNRALENDGIYAPFDGRVGNVISLKPGDRINAFDTVIFLADESRLFISTEYISDSVWKTATGGAYALIGDKRYEVERVPVDQQAYISAVMAGSTVYCTFNIVGPEGWENEVSAGSYCALIFVTNYYPDVLLIPANAVLSDSGSKYIYVVTEDGGREKRDIKVRSFGDAIYSIVTEGLEEGEVIYVTDK